MTKSTMPSRGATRRLRALMCIGYSAAHLSRLLGLSYGTVNRILHSEDTPIKAGTFKLIDNLYEELSMKPLNQMSHSISRAKSDARRRGWHPPLAWDDIDRDKDPNS